MPTDFSEESMDRRSEVMEQFLDAQSPPEAKRALTALNQLIGESLKLPYIAALALTNDRHAAIFVINLLLRANLLAAEEASRELTTDEWREMSLRLKEKLTIEDCSQCPNQSLCSDRKS